MYWRAKMYDPNPNNNDGLWAAQRKAASRDANPIPSAGPWADIERGATPREKFWDVLLAYTNTGGVHFEDHEGLRGLDLL